MELTSLGNITLVADHLLDHQIGISSYKNNLKAQMMRIGEFRYIKLPAVFLAFYFSFACAPINERDESAEIAQSSLSKRPNIVWLVAEDLSPHLPDFGDLTITTPSISELANEGVKYTNVFSPSGVCAPSRAALATGMYPSSIGANHMRTTSHTDKTGLPKYEAVPPPNIKMLSEYLRRQGYYTTNNFKTDYQFKEPVTAWDENGHLAHWRNRAPGQPFFSVFNFTTTHESGLFEPYGFRHIESRHYFSTDKKRLERLSKLKGKTEEKDTPVHVDKNADFPIPPYLQNTDTVHRDLWKMYNNIAEMDKQVGSVLAQLKEDGLLENTIIFFYSDHGGPMPRQKRLIYDSGLKVPLIIRFPNAENQGEIDDQLISFVDFAPTTMALADISAPPNMQGRNFLNSTNNERKFIHAAADRFDGFTDTIRAVRTDRYKYIRNYRPDQPYYLPVEYREQIPTMRELLELHTAGQLNEVQAQWFRKTKPKEELFDIIADPHELNNLADDQKYAGKLAMLSAEMDRWLAAIGDEPMLPEQALINELWQGKSQQPVTKDPIVHHESNRVTLTSETEGASIGYKFVGNADAETWHIYTQPFNIAPGQKLTVVAHRIGYKESNKVTFTSPVH